MVVSSTNHFEQLWSQVDAADKAEGEGVHHQEEPLYAWGWERQEVIMGIIVIFIAIVNNGEKSSF